MGGKIGRLERISQVFNSAEEILFDDSSKIVLMSDCHRGDGSWSDDFSRNQNIYFSALAKYYHENYTYIELGDGDELWENNISDIIKFHNNVFWLLSKFFKEGRLYLIYGNHDMVKKNNKFVKKHFFRYFNEANKEYCFLFPNIKIHEGLVLKHRITGRKILLIHGHQVDFFNDTLWKLARFLVRYIWRPLNLFGVNDPTRPAKNYRKKEKIGRRLIEWVIKNKCILIAGHSHRPSFPDLWEAPYFNDGSCVHPREITCIEIVNGYIMLVKWSVKTKKDGTLFIDKDIIEGPMQLDQYYNFFK